MQWLRWKRSINKTVMSNSTHNFYIQAWIRFDFLLFAFSMSDLCHGIFNSQNNHKTMNIKQTCSTVLYIYTPKTSHNAKPVTSIEKTVMLFDSKYKITKRMLVHSVCNNSNDTYGRLTKIITKCNRNYYVLLVKWDRYLTRN